MLRLALFSVAACAVPCSPPVRGSIAATARLAPVEGLQNSTISIERPVMSSFARRIRAGCAVIEDRPAEAHTLVTDPTAASGCASRDVVLMAQGASTMELTVKLVECVAAKL